MVFRESTSEQCCACVTFLTKKPTELIVCDTVIQYAMHLIFSKKNIKKIIKQEQ